MMRSLQHYKLGPAFALVSFLGLAACSVDADKVVQPVATKMAPASFARIKANAPAEMRPAIEEREARLVAVRQIMREALNDAKKNANKRFGPKGSRSLVNACRGVEKLLTEYLPCVDAAAGFSRPDSAIRGRVAMAMAATKCRTVRVASIARPVYANLALVPAPAAFTSEEDSLWVEANITSAVPNAIDLYSLYSPSSHASFTGGLNEYEAEFFENAACELDANQATYEAMGGPGSGGGEGGGEDEMSVASFVGCGKVAAGACASNVAANWLSITKDVVQGVAWGGPWGGVLFGVLSVAADCGAGALAGYMVCVYAT
jgi:hypothetical protein